ncbi:hypothetical protein [Pseudomonas sp. SIMBA_068]|uniref:hypothetical protein n=1 Tax=Pseudomonas sp. SIMBA_068 TaxID=3085808 RepID=UPI00397AF754
MLLFSHQEQNRASVVKLIGSALVLALAFAANNAFTYGLAIFIVATLVTDLDFLEKLAALFWNRDKYWEYQLQKQTIADAEDKAAKEAAAILSEDQEAFDTTTAPTNEQSGGSTPSGRESTVGQKAPDMQPDSTNTVILQNPKFVNATTHYQLKRAMTGRILAFEAKVAEALVAPGGPLSEGVASSGFILKTPERDYQIDLIVQAGAMYYVAEIKYGVSPQLVKSGEMRAREVARIYESYLKDKGISNPIVMPMLIVSSRADCSRVGRGITVLRYDEYREAFV